MTLAEALLFTLPAFAANMAPVIAAKILPQWATRVDFNITFNHAPLFGAHKTWRGLIAGGLAGGLLGLTSYGFWLGMLVGITALVGDLIGSFIKRRLNIKSGQPLPVVDQVDYLIPFIIVSSFWLEWSWQSAGFILLCGLCGNPTINLIARRLNLRN